MKAQEKFGLNFDHSHDGGEPMQGIAENEY